jgi:AraC family transcriptional regulator, arabinose operon regulatory protein
LRQLRRSESRSKKDDLVMSVTMLPGTRLYTWKYSVLLQVASQVIDRSERPSRRLAASLIVSNANTMRLGLNNRPARSYRAALLAPGVLRNSIEAHEAEVSVLEMDVASPAFESLWPRLVAAEAVELPDSETAQLQALLAPGFLAPLTCAEARALFQRCFDIVTAPTAAAGRTRDPRVRKAIELIEQLPFYECSLSSLARHCCLSESRLRHLFRQQMGCTFSEFARWINVRKAMELHNSGTPFGVAVARAGFHDQAHFNHAAREFLAVRPSQLADLSKVQITRC